MKRNKMVFVYGLIMLVVVALVVVLGYVTGPQHDERENEAQTLIDEKQNSIRKLEEELVTVKKENTRLTEKNMSYELDATKDKETISKLENEKNELATRVAELEAAANGNTGIDTGNADGVTMAQALADLKGIYEEFKAGNVQKAKDSFGKIEPMGYDDATLAYYELLKDVLK